LDVAVDGFGKDVPKKEVEHNTKDVNIVFVAFDELERPIAFMSYKNINKEIVYLSGIVVKKNYQGKGIFSNFMENMINEIAGKTKYLTVRTQNPIVYYVINKYIKQLYPNEDKIPRQIYELALLVDGRVNENLVIKNCYGRCLSNKVDKSKDNRINKLFEKIDLNVGDAFLIVGQLN